MACIICCSVKSNKSLILYFLIQDELISSYDDARGILLELFLKFFYLLWGSRGLGYQEFAKYDFREK